MSLSWLGWEGEVRAPGPPPPIGPRVIRAVLPHLSQPPPPGMSFWDGMQNGLVSRTRRPGSEEEEDGGDAKAHPKLLTFWQVSRNSSKVTTPSPFLSIFCKGRAGAQRGHPCPRWQ